jgi:hypothetical protein
MLYNKKMKVDLQIPVRTTGWAVAWMQLNDKTIYKIEKLHRWCLRLIVVVGFECSWDPESYACDSVATGRVTHAGQVKG